MPLGRDDTLVNTLIVPKVVKTKTDANHVKLRITLRTRTTVTYVAFECNELFSLIIVPILASLIRCNINAPVIHFSQIFALLGKLSPISQLVGNCTVV